MSSNNNPNATSNDGNSSNDQQINQPINSPQLSSLSHPQEMGSSERVRIMRQVLYEFDNQQSFDRIPMAQSNQPQLGFVQGSSSSNRSTPQQHQGIATLGNSSQQQQPQSDHTLSDRSAGIVSPSQGTITSYMNILGTKKRQREGQSLDDPRLPKRQQMDANMGRNHPQRVHLASNEEVKDDGQPVPREQSPQDAHRQGEPRRPPVLVLQPIPELSEENAQHRSDLVSVDSNSSQLVDHDQIARRLEPAEAQALVEMRESIDGVHQEGQPPSSNQPIQRERQRLSNSDLDSLLTCGICYVRYSFLRIPIKLPCEHTFCAACISQVDDPRCPVCRRRFTSLVTLERNYGLLNILVQQSPTSSQLLVPHDRHAPYANIQHYISVRLRFVVTSDVIRDVPLAIQEYNQTFPERAEVLDEAQISSIMDHYLQRAAQNEREYRNRDTNLREREERERRRAQLQRMANEPSQMMIQPQSLPNLPSAPVPPSQPVIRPDSQPIEPVPPSAPSQPVIRLDSQPIEPVPPSAPSQLPVIMPFFHPRGQTISQEELARYYNRVSTMQERWERYQPQPSAPMRTSQQSPANQGQSPGVYERIQTRFQIDDLMKKYAHLRPFLIGPGEFYFQRLRIPLIRLQSFTYEQFVSYMDSAIGNRQVDPNQELTRFQYMINSKEQFQHLVAEIIQYNRDVLKCPQFPSLFQPLTEEEDPIEYPVDPRANTQALFDDMDENQLRRQVKVLSSAKLRYFRQRDQFRFNGLPVNDEVEILGFTFRLNKKNCTHCKVVAIEIQLRRRQNYRLSLRRINQGYSLDVFEIALNDLAFTLPIFTPLTQRMIADFTHRYFPLVKQMMMQRYQRRQGSQRNVALAITVPAASDEEDDVVIVQEIQDRIQPRDPSQNEDRIQPRDPSQNEDRIQPRNSSQNEGRIQARVSFQGSQIALEAPAQQQQASDQEQPNVQPSPAQVIDLTSPLRPALVDQSRANIEDANRQQLIANEHVVARPRITRRAHKLDKGTGILKAGLSLQNILQVFRLVVYPFLKEANKGRKKHTLNFMKAYADFRDAYQRKDVVSWIDYIKKHYASFLNQKLSTQEANKIRPLSLPSLNAMLLSAISPSTSKLTEQKRCFVIDCLKEDYHKCSDFTSSSNVNMPESIEDADDELNRSNPFIQSPVPDAYQQFQFSPQAVQSLQSLAVMMGDVSNHVPASRGQQDNGPSNQIVGAGPAADQQQQENLHHLIPPGSALSMLPVMQHQPGQAVPIIPRQQVQDDQGARMTEFFAYRRRCDQRNIPPMDVTMWKVYWDYKRAGGALQDPFQYAWMVAFNSSRVQGQTHVNEQQTLLFFREMVPFGHHIPSDSDVLEYLDEVARQQ